MTCLPSRTATIRPSVHPSVPSVRPTVRPSYHEAASPQCRTNGEPYELPTITGGGRADAQPVRIPYRALRGIADLELRLDAAAAAAVAPAHGAARAFHWSGSEGRR